MFKSRPADRVHAVATFFWTHDKCSVLLLVIQTKLLIQFDWIGSLSAGKGGLIDFVLFCNVVSSRGSRIAQCSTGIKSGIGLEQHQTEPDQTRSGRNSFFFFYMYIYILYLPYVFILESWLAADFVTLLLEHKAGPFIYLSRQDVNFISRPHSLTKCTSSTCICIWNMHDAYITRRGLSGNLGLSCLFPQRNSGFRDLIFAGSI